MSVKIRLMRVGKKKQPTYRVVVADERSPRDGRFIEIIGQYAPRQDPSSINVDNARALHWLQHGAVPTESASKILDIAGVYDEYKQANGKVPSAKPKAKTPKAKTVKAKAEAEAVPPASEADAEAPAEETAAVEEEAAAE